VRTLARLWRDAVAAGRSSPAFLVEEPAGWRAVAWDESAGRVDALAGGFLALGIAKGDRVSLVARTRVEWTLCDLALASIGAVSVPIYATSSGPECAYVLANSGARAVVVENAEQLTKLAAHREELPALEHVVAMEEAEPPAVPLAELEARGRAHLAADGHAVERALAAVAEDDLLTIIYTSGTTGDPKGCMLRNRNYVEMARMVGKTGVIREGASVVLFLPLAHAFGRLVTFVAVDRGATIAFCPDTTRVIDAVAAVRPQCLPSVPRVFEKLHAGVGASFAEATGLKRALVDWALRVGYPASALRERGRPLPPGLAAQHRLAGRLVYSKVKRRLGGRLELAISGGAPLAKEIVAFFHALDIPVMEGYGLTESGTAATLNLPGAYRIGSVGRPFEGCEVRVADDGEILVRGENVFAGYYGDEEATRAVLTDDGWLRTGDVGRLDEDGFLTITDRKKDIIITAGGKNISPQNIENALKSASPLVSQALVVGDRRPYLVALLTVDRAEAAKAGIADAGVAAAVDRAVADVNAALGRVEQIKRHAVLPRDFTPEQGEITPTLKLRRRVCEEHFREEIEALYAS
jgi:long-chain acyl-CoA synthetase